MADIDNTGGSDAASSTSQSFEEIYGVTSSGSRDITTGNQFVMNAGMSPVPSYNFMLRVEGVMDLPCRSIRAFSKEVEFELIQEGGLNDYVHMRRKPISKPFYFEVERYIGVDYIDPLPLGAELLLPVILLVSRNPNNFGAASRVYTFTGCTVTKKEYGQMDAEKSGLFIETTTIAYRELLCVDAPWSEAIPFLPNDPNPKRSQMMEAAKTEAQTAQAEAQKQAAANAKQADADRLAREAQLKKDQQVLNDATGDAAQKARQAEEDALRAEREAQAELDRKAIEAQTGEDAQQQREQEEAALSAEREAQVELDRKTIEDQTGEAAQQRREREEAALSAEREKQAAADKQAREQAIEQALAQQDAENSVGSDGMVAASTSEES